MIDGCRMSLIDHIAQESTARMEIRGSRAAWSRAR
jgi:hypothetical protein